MSANSTEAKKAPAKKAEGKPEDLSLILPSNGEVVVGGVKAEVRRLKTREFLLLMRVVTQGLGESLVQFKIDTNDPEQLQGDLMAMLMLAVPNAIEEFGAFLLSIVDPKDPSQRPDLTKEMANPEIEVLLDVLGTMVEQEKDEMVMLAGKARAWLSRIQEAMKK